MANDKSNILTIAVIAILLGAVMLSDPRCDRGCKTLAQHLIGHGLDFFFRA